MEEEYHIRLSSRERLSGGKIAGDDMGRHFGKSSTWLVALRQRKSVQ